MHETHFDYSLTNTGLLKVTNIDTGEYKTSENDLDPAITISKHKHIT